MISIYPLQGIGEVRPGDDLAAMLGESIDRSGRGSVLVVTQKIVSKSECRYVRLDDIEPDDEARELAEKTRKDPRLVALVLRESVEVLRAVPDVLITRHRLGLVMANAGIDQSNLGPGHEGEVLLLPEDPDRSARTLSERLGLPVVISDSFGRPWRMGVVNVAIGSAGLGALVDRRGKLDRDGRPLEVTQIAVADMIASAAGLAAGEGDEGIPAVLVSGLALEPGDIPATALLRPVEQDLFR